jgi:hypothetical protein
VARFRPGPGLDARIAQQYAVPHARRLADALADRMRANAPDAAAWITAQDERVRPTHRDADGQTVPDNLRFALERPGGGHELAQAPRDPDLSLANRQNCRCLSVHLPGVIAERVGVGDVVLRRTSAHATVSVTFPRIVESEYPGAGDSGGGWVRRSIEETAASSAARGR